MYKVTIAVTAKGWSSPRRAFDEAAWEFSFIAPGVTPSKIRNNWIGDIDNHCRLEGSTTVESYEEVEKLMHRADTVKDCSIEIWLVTEPEATEEIEEADAEAS